jgi:PKD repeat protein
MKTILYYLALLCVFFIPLSDLIAQEWVDMMHDPEEQFSETVKEFDNWWGDREVTKGSGWKQFQRWKYYMEQRVGSDGKQSGHLNTYREFKKYLETNGVSRTTTGQWQELGPVLLPYNGTSQPNGLGRITGLAFHPTDPDVIFIGSPSGGFWKSTDYGSTWQDMSVSLVRLGVSSIVINPSNPQTIYIGTGDRDGGDAPGLGVWRSADGGVTWASWNNGMGNRTVNEILMHPSNPNILIAATNSRIYRSDDGGANWSQEYSGSTMKDIAFHPTNPDIVYAAGSIFLRSTNNGQSWTQITSGLASTSRMAIAVTIANPSLVYLFSGNSSGFVGLFKSSNEGVNFTSQSNSPNLCGYDTNGGSGSQAWYDMVALGNPTDQDHIIVGAINIWESFNGGVTWSIVSHWYGAGGHPDVHADQHVLEWSPHTNDLFAGHDGGLHRSSNVGQSFTEISDGLAIAQVYKLGLSQTQSDLTICGYQDNGTAFIDGGSWATEIGGDGMECMVDPSDPTVMYGALYYGDIRRSKNGGSSFVGITSGISESGGWVTPYKVDPQYPDTMIAGFSNIWVSKNCRSASSPTWTQKSSFSGTNSIIDLDISKSDPSVVYVSRSGTNKFYHCANIHLASPVWTNLTGNLPTSSSPVDIEIHPTTPSTVWIAISGEIHKSTNAGLTWIDYSGTLPSISLNTIVADPISTNEALYVGMDVGVYYRDNTMSDWVLFSNMLPNVEVTELEISRDGGCGDNGIIQAATYGRGLWESPLYDDGSNPPVACFSATPTAACQGLTISFEDLSSGLPTSWNWSFSPATYSFVNGTTVSSANPQVQFSAPGFYNVSLTVTNSNGSNSTTKTNYINIDGIPALLPINEDFETFTNCGTITNCEVEICPLHNDWVNVSNTDGDDIDWRTNNGNTPSSNTGPSIDANPGTSEGKYLYTEASTCFEQTAIMVSPCIALSSSGHGQITFSYHMSGADMGSLHLDIYSNGSWILDIMPVISGDQGNQWNQRTVILSEYIDETIKLRFRGITGLNYTSDIAIDDIFISDDEDLIVKSTNDDGIFSLRWINKLVQPGDSIHFDPAISGQTISLTTSPIILHNNVSLVAPVSDNISISGETINNTIEVSDGSVVHIEGLGIISGDGGSGRGIINNGQLTLKDINVLDNPASTGGVPIIHNNGEVIIKGNCQILE